VGETVTLGVTVNDVVADCPPLSVPVIVYVACGSTGTVNVHDHEPVAGIEPPTVHESPFGAFQLTVTVAPAVYPVPETVTPDVPTVPLVGETVTLGVTVNDVVADCPPLSVPVIVYVACGSTGTVNVHDHEPADPPVEGTTPATEQDSPFRAVQLTVTVAPPVYPVPATLTPDVPTVAATGATATLGSTTNEAVAAPECASAAVIVHVPCGSIGTENEQANVPLDATLAPEQVRPFGAFQDTVTVSPGV
jgi:hypothetical protein